jgi:2-hydroxychromene-2-carboxylate isomerase
VNQPRRPQVDWYFDFISPYAYLQSTQLGRFDALADVRIRPVLFAGLLGHFGQKGPAEIAPKRVHTYRDVVWRAHRDGIALTLPSSHPFNPLPLLRIHLALGGGRDLLARLFAWVWAEGHVPTELDAWNRLMTELGVDDWKTLTARAAVKEALRVHTDAAIARGVFGVPTFDIAGELYWGADCTDMALAALSGDPFLASAPMRAAARVGDGVVRNVGG